MYSALSAMCHTNQQTTLTPYFNITVARICFADAPEGSDMLQRAMDDFRRHYARYVLAYHYYTAFKAQEGLSRAETELMMALENQLIELWNNQYPQYKAAVPISDVDDELLIRKLVRYLASNKHMHQALHHCKRIYQDSPICEHTALKRDIFQRIIPFIGNVERRTSSLPLSRARHALHHMRLSMTTTAERLIIQPLKQLHTRLDMHPIRGLSRWLDA